MPLLRKNALLAAKIETTSGTLETLAAADGAHNVFDFSVVPNITFTERMGQGSFSPLRSIAETYGATATFSLHLYGSGTGTAPTWADTFLPACGFAKTVNTFNPVTDDPGATVKTITIAAYVDGLRYLMRGCAGSFKIVAETGKLARIEFTFQGAWAGVSDQTNLAPTFPTVVPIRCANAVYTIGSASPCFSSFEVDAGNEVFLRACATNTDSSGIAAGIITGRRVTGTIDPETVYVASKDNWGNWLSGVEQAFSLAMSSATDKVTIAMPKWQVINLQPGDRDGMVIDTMTFQANRNAAAGNDELSIAFAVP